LCESQAGIPAFLAERPGNKPLPVEHPFKVIDNFDKLFETYVFTKPQ
jgi:methionine salvage enolase-phosphatase E1